MANKYIYILSHPSGFCSALMRGSGQDGNVRPSRNRVKHTIDIEYFVKTVDISTG
jgi:hypothetical protein